MFQHLNKIIKGHYFKNKMRSSSGQVAVILILIIAALLIFYAVSINFGRFSDVKAAVSIAANTSASMLASSMTSFGQMLSETNVQGQGPGDPYCKKNSVFAAILAVIILVVVIVLQQYQLLPVVGSIWLSVVGLALAVVSLGLQVIVVQPGITAAWNRITSKSISTNNQFTENALQSALGKLVTDSVRVPDVTDMDTDGVWVENPSSPRPWEDSITRYAAYYKDRISGVERPNSAAIGNFIAGLKNLVEADGSGEWGGGFHDHLDKIFCMGTSECHPCCLPGLVVEEVGGEEYTVRPEECEDGVTDWQLECEQASPYYDPEQPAYDPNNHPWMYDFAYENPNNEIYSFRELLGKDDEHRLYYKYDEGIDPSPNGLPQHRHIMPEHEQFYLEDATGYWPTDNRKGVYPFFHKMKEWGLSLHLADPTNTDPDDDIRECQLCDQRGTFDGNPCFDCRDPIMGTDVGPFPHPIDQLPQLTLPIDPDTDCFKGNCAWGPAVPNNSTWHVDGSNPIPGNPPLWVDKVRKVENIIAFEDICAEDLSVATNGIWKEGEDMFCSQEWPYNLKCTKSAGGCHGEVDDCSCIEVPDRAEDFPDDALDALYYGLGDFIQWAERFVDVAESDLDRFITEFQIWYPGAARWIEEPPGGLCYSCDLEDPNQGILQQFRQEMNLIKDRLYMWLGGVCSPGDPLCSGMKSYTGRTCEEVWCAPPLGCPLVQDDEEEKFTNGLYGPGTGVDDIVACLDHNVNHLGGNAARFQACLNRCSDCQSQGWEDGYPDCITPEVNIACGGEPGSYLPRTLLPDFDPNAEGEDGFEPVDWEYIKAVIGCPGECTDCYEDCDACRAAICEPIHDACRAAAGATYDACMDACAPDDLPECTDPCLFAAVGDYAACDTARDNCYDTECPGCEDDCVCSLDSQNCVIVYGDPADSSPPPDDSPIWDEIEVAKGSCGEDPEHQLDHDAGGSDTFLDLIDRSIPEAVNQVEKFQTRLEFLQPLYDEADKTYKLFDEAATALGLFLDGPAAGLINARSGLTGPSGDDDTELPYHAVYGWQDEPPDPEDPGSEGKWHIVKVEARIPGNCDSACSFSQARPDPEWPKIHAWTKGFLSSETCFELQSDKGSVKFRAIRYDEERISDPVAFPNALPIWRFRSAHPKRPQGLEYQAGGAFDPGRLGIVCAGSYLELFSDGSSTEDIYDGAFLLDSWDDNPDCWNLAHELLARGVVDETCAQYSWDYSSDRMNFKFVPCKEF